MDDPDRSHRVSLAAALGVFDQLDDPCTPLTASEIAEELDCPRRTAYRKLDTLAERGDLRSKKTGARGRVWWRPVDEHGRQQDDVEDEAREFGSFVRAVEDYAIFTLDPGGHVRSWNSGAEQIKGYSEEEIGGEHFSTFYPDDARDDDVPEQLLAEAAAEGAVEDEGWRVRKDGELFWANVTITAIRDDGELRGFTKVTRDMTERRQREEELRRERELTEQFRLLVDNVEEYAIFMMDEAGHVRSWNSGAEQIKGYSEAEIVGEHFSTFYSDEAVERGVPEENLDRARATGSVEDEGWRVRKDGELFWANVTITAVRDDDGDLRGFAKVTRDMTERHRREEELERERELTEQILNASPVGITVHSPDGDLVTASDRATEILGVGEDALAGTTYDEFDWVSHDEDGDLVPVPEQPFDRVRGTGENVFDYETTIERPDGESVWLSVNGAPLQTPGSDRNSVVLTFDDVTQFKRIETALREEKARFESMVDEVTDYAIFMLDRDGNVRSWNQGAERLKGYAEDEIIGEHFSTFYPEDERDRPERLLEQAAADGRVADEGWRVRKDGSRFWAHVTITALHDDDGGIRGFSKVTRDLTERKRREDQLTALNETSRELIEADTADAVTGIVIDAAEAGLELPVTTVALYDDEHGTLRPTAHTSRAEELMADVPLLAADTESAWDAFGDDEPVIVSDPSDGEDDAESTLTGGVIVPLGRHGVFVTGFTSPGGPDDEVIDFAKVVAADLEAALNHADRQELLRERETLLEEQNEALERVNRVNGVIRTIDQALVDATAREEIEQAVCDELATTGPYRFAWIGRADATNETVTPHARAGDEADCPDGSSIVADEPMPGEHPAGTTVRTHEPATVAEVRSDPPFESWQKELLKRGHRSLVSVPLLYEDSLYGVLTAHADEPDTFTGMERQVLEELGETIGHAINALESKHALVSNDVVELEFRIHDPEIPILQLVSRTGCEFEFENVVSRADDSLRVFFVTRGADPEAIRTFTDESPAVSEVRLITDQEDGCLFECLVTDVSFTATLLDHGAVPRAMTAADGEGRVVVELPQVADVREFTEMLQAKYPESELIARRTREVPVRTPNEFKAEFEDRLTERQREVLQTAYFSGYFDSPRKRTGEEIGESLDVSQPTVNHHLRASQRKFLGMLYDDQRSAVPLDE